jgi:hypothetical protein
MFSLDNRKVWCNVFVVVDLAGGHGQRGMKKMLENGVQFICIMLGAKYFHVLNLQEILFE